MSFRPWTALINGQDGLYDVPGLVLYCHWNKRSLINIRETAALSLLPFSFGLKGFGVGVVCHIRRAQRQDAELISPDKQIDQASLSAPNNFCVLYTFCVPQGVRCIH